MNHGDFGRSAIVNVGYSFGGVYKNSHRGQYIRVCNGIKMPIYGEVYQLHASRTKPNTKYVRQHLFINLERDVFKVVEVSNWKGYDNERETHEKIWICNQDRGI